MMYKSYCFVYIHQDDLLRLICEGLLEPTVTRRVQPQVVLDIDRDAGCCKVAFDENPSVPGFWAVLGMS